MNFLTELILYCSITGVITAVASVILGRYRLKAAIELKACERFPHSEDARKSLKFIGTALINRMSALGFPAIYSDKDHRFALLDIFGLDGMYDIVRLFQMAHACGFEIVMRPRKEGRPGGGVEELDEYITSMREEWYARQKRTKLQKILLILTGKGDVTVNKNEE